MKDKSITEGTHGILNHKLGYGFAQVGEPKIAQIITKEASHSVTAVGRCSGKQSFSLTCTQIKIYIQFSPLSNRSCCTLLSYTIAINEFAMLSPTTLAGLP